MLVGGGARLGHVGHDCADSLLACSASVATRNASAAAHRSKRHLGVLLFFCLWCCCCELSLGAMASLIWEVAAIKDGLAYTLLVAGWI